MRVIGSKTILVIMLFKLLLLIIVNFGCVGNQDNHQDYDPFKDCSYCDTLGERGRAYIVSIDLPDSLFDKNTLTEKVLPGKEIISVEAFAYSDKKVLWGLNNTDSLLRVSIGIDYVESEKIDSKYVEEFKTQYFSMPEVNEEAPKVLDLIELENITFLKYGDNRVTTSGESSFVHIHGYIDDSTLLFASAHYIGSGVFDVHLLSKWLDEIKWKKL